jgi:hypothetical protein
MHDFKEAGITTVVRETKEIGGIYLGGLKVCV